MYVVGAGGVILHWDGAELSKLETGIQSILFTVHGTTDGPVLAVGGANEGLALRIEGTDVHLETLPPGQPPLNGVFVQPNGTAVAVGARGSLLERNGIGIWSRRRHDALRGQDAITLHAVSASSHLWSVGGDFSAGRNGFVLTDWPEPIEAILGAEKPRLPRRDSDAGLADATAGDMAFLDGRVPAMNQDMGLRDAMLETDVGLSRDAAPGEQNDGMASEDTGHLADSARPPDAAAAVCGDGVLGGDEACDDGNLVGADGCDPLCRLECGNGRVDGTEECDDGGRVPDDGCDAQCHLECGNGVLDGREEECDDGNRVEEDGCDDTCLLECGNGQVERDETCDDGGRMDGDGCSARCQLEPARAGEACEDRLSSGAAMSQGAMDDFFPCALCNASVSRIVSTLALWRRCNVT